jgi:hypothetical protein
MNSPDTAPAVLRPKINEQRRRAHNIALGVQTLNALLFSAPTNSVPIKHTHQRLTECTPYVQIQQPATHNPYDWVKEAPTRPITDTKAPQLEEVKKDPNTQPAHPAVTCVPDTGTPTTQIAPQEAPNSVYLPMVNQEIKPPDDCLLKQAFDKHADKVSLVEGQCSILYDNKGNRLLFKLIQWYPDSNRNDSSCYNPGL